MKKIFSYISVLVLAFAALPVKAQNVVFNAYFDSANVDTKEMRIGEHARLILELGIDSGYNVELQIPDKLTADIEQNTRFKRTRDIQKRMYNNIVCRLSADNTPNNGKGE